jgi:hypothetical protein
MKVVLLFISFFFIVTEASCSGQTSSTKNDTQTEVLVADNVSDQKSDDDLLYEHLRLKAESAKKYCSSKGFSEQHCILVNFSIHSGKQRFFVWNFEKDTVLYSSLCAHGMGRKSTESKPVYSNDEGSYCSSPGRYKIGISSYSQYGINIHYKLHGQDSTNSNAYKRIVVLHSHSPIPDRDIYPQHLPLGFSLGCPVISDVAMRKTDTLLKESKKPVMLLIYDEHY